MKIDDKVTSYREGIEKNRIVDCGEEEFDKFLESVECLLCKKVLIEPRECTRCQRSFCLPCLRTHKRRSYYECPSRCNNAQHLKAHRITRAILSRLRVTCKNRFWGCREIINYEKLEEHEGKCRYQIAKCNAFNQCAT